MTVPHLQVNVLTSVDEVSTFWRWLTDRPKGYVACDIETGSNPKGHETEWAKPGFHIRMVQFGDTDGGWAIPYQAWPGLVKEAFNWCSQHRIKTVWWNGFTFDAQALRVAAGITLDPVHMEDCLIYSRLRGYGDESHGLKEQGVKELGGWVGVGQSILKRAMDTNKWTWTDIPFGFQPYPMYGVVDVIATAMLYELWEADRIRDAKHHDLEIATSVDTNRMARRGAAVDVGYMLQQAELHLQQEKELLARAEQQGWGDPTIRRNVMEILADAGALDLTRRSEITGEISLDKEQLRNSPHPLAALILEYRHTQLLRTRYFEKIAEMADDNGIIHPSIWSMAAKTSRMSVSNPPLQQLPADSPIVRNGFIPREPGHVLVGADFGQIEMRLWAALNKDTALLDVFREADATGGDFFVIMGQKLYRDPGFQKSDIRRKIIKNSSYATIYTGGDRRIAQTAGLPVEEVTPVVSQLREMYPSFADVGRSMVDIKHDQTAEVTTPWGRKFRAKDRNNFRILPNWKIQGHSAEILKVAMCEASAAGLGDYMMLPVHDELALSVPRHLAREVAAELEEIMGSVVSAEEYGVSVKASSYIADRWGEADK